MKSQLKTLELTEYEIEGEKYWAAEHPEHKGYWATTSGHIVSKTCGYNGTGNSKRGASDPKLLKPYLSKKDGYEKVSICTDHGRSEQLVHRLVAQTYLEAPDDDLRDWDIPRSREHVNHIDGNPRNNKIANLEWTCPKENKEHSQLLKAIKEEAKGKGAATD